MSRLPSTETMYRALIGRDTTFEGIFYVGVRTTGIFCRPTCPAKKPRPENVEYFASSEEALSEGYRPCSRCRPSDKEKAMPELVRRLCREIESSPTGKLSDSELRALGVEPSTARRQFQRHFGMTFHAYHRARRMGLALDEVRRGSLVINAQLNQGFESASGFWEAFRRVFGAPASQADGINCLHARRLETPLGAMLALANRDGLHLLEFVDRSGLEQEIISLGKRNQCVIVPGNNPHLDRLSEELKRYFSGVDGRFTVPLVMTGSSFEREVWSALQIIPPGETCSYAELAQRVGRPAAVRAVGRANGRNRLALIIPCHRVIRADGQLCGYSGGIWRKQWLLEHERQSMERAA